MYEIQINKTRKNVIFHYSEFHVSLFHDHQVNDGNKEQGHNITRKLCTRECTSVHVRTCV